MHPWIRSRFRWGTRSLGARVGPKAQRLMPKDLDLLDGGDHLEERFGGVGCDWQHADEERVERVPTDDLRSLVGRRGAQSLARLTPSFSRMWCTWFLTVV